MNKSMYLILLFAVIFNCKSSAQDNKADVGFEFGPGWGTIHGDTLFKNNQESLPVFGGGFFGQLYISNNFLIKTGLYYEQKGTSINFEIPDGNGQIIDYVYKFKYDYLTLPLLLKLKFGSTINFFLNAGPEVGYLINTTNVSPLNDTTYTPQDNNKFDFLIAAGGGLGIDLGKKLSLSCELRDNIGLTNIQKDVNSLEAKTSTLFLLFGLAIKI